MTDRFWTKVDRSAECWRWTAATNTAGYGVWWNGDRLVLAHRESYRREVGPIPEGRELDHLCRNRWCVRPDHLDPVTRAENVRRGDGPRLLRERNANITHCPHGHEYTENNTHIQQHGGRRCRACARERSRRTYHERKP